MNFLKSVPYEFIASVIRQCHKAKHSETETRIAAQTLSANIAIGQRAEDALSILSKLQTSS